MKKYHPRCPETMTVAELVAHLSKFPPDMPVVSAWEGQRMPVAPFSEYHKTDVEAKDGLFLCDVLVLDVE